jgi:hypothetical protein
MGNVLLLLGKPNRDLITVESYQLGTSGEFVAGYYAGEVRRMEFYRDLGDIFARRVLQAGYPSNTPIDVQNGFWINPRTQDRESIPKLGDRSVKRFLGKFEEKLLVGEMYKLLDEDSGIAQERARLDEKLRSGEKLSFEEALGLDASGKDFAAHFDDSH